MKQSLNGSWLCTLPNGMKLQVQAPGCFDIHAPAWDIGRAVRYETDFVCDAGRYARLVFGAVSYACEVRLNGVTLGSHEGMWDAFSLPAGHALRSGVNHLEVDVVKPGYSDDDPYPLRQVLSGFIPDVLTTFGGLWEDVTLEDAQHFFVDSHSASGDCEGLGQVSCTLSLCESASGTAELCLFAPDGGTALVVCSRFSSEAGELQLEIPFRLESPELWSLDSPALYRYELTVSVNGQREILSRRFGFREIRAKGSQMLINDRPIYMHGILHWGYNDREILPRFSEVQIRSELEKIRACGFNAIKHCLYLPGRRYLELMDEYGLLCWVELPLWLPDVTPALNERIRREYPRMLNQLQGHPSVMILSLGCELNDSVDGDILQEMYWMAKNRLHALVRDNSGSGECYGGLTVDYADFFDYHFYAELPNLEPLLESFTPGWRCTRPWVFGEFADSDTMRDLAVIRKERGVERLRWEADDPHVNPISVLKPDFYAGTHDEKLVRSGIRADFEHIRRLSQNHAMVHRKVTVEMTRSFPEVCGYNITHLCDVPIATSGILDDLGRVKFDPAQFRLFNNDCVLVPAWDLTRTWIGGDRVLTKERYNFSSGAEYGVHMLFSNYGDSDETGAVLRYRLMCREHCLQQGENLCPALPLGSVTEAGCIRLTLPKTDAALMLHLEVSLWNSREVCRNIFPIFVYPRREIPNETLAVYDPLGALVGIEECYRVLRLNAEEAVPEKCAALVTSLLNHRAKKYLQQGGKVILVQPQQGELPVVEGPLWREGMIRSFDHPIVGDVQQEDWLDDLRYYSMTTDVSFAVDAVAGSEPVLRRYDCRKWEASDYMMTFPDGKGRCVATTLRMAGGMGKASSGVNQNPFAVYLLDRILQYLSCCPM